jgi:outer membrane protein OmpA-like peptidoglycan-associated protein
MGKRVIRLTEADIEKIVKKVIKEQSRNYLVNRPGGGTFKVEGDTLYFTGDIQITKTSEFYKIWEVGAKPTYKVDVQNRKVSPTGLLNLQSQLFNGNRQSRTMKDMESSNMLPLEREFVNPVSGNIYYYYLTENGEIGAQCSTVINVKNKTLTDKSELMKLNAGGNLPVESNDNTVTFGETYINVAKNTNLLVAVSFGPGTIKTTPVEPKLKKPEFATETIKLDLVDVFKFDSIDMNYPSGYQEILNKFKEDLSNAVKVLRGLKGFLEKQNLVVNGYASRDDNPNEKVQGKFSGCRGYGDGSRGQYNLCLSEARAKKVAEDLQKIFDSLNINVDIKSKGYGETDKFGPAWSKEEPTQPKDTQANRRITFNIPKYTETINK